MSTERGASEQMERPGLGPWRAGDRPDTETFPDGALAGSITGRFLTTARRYPDRIALSSPAGTWSYDALHADVMRVASGIANRLDHDAPTPVALLLHHDGPLVSTILGVIAAGHIVVVLDPQAPPAQSVHVLSECSPPLLVHDQAHTALAHELVTSVEGCAAVLSDSLAGTDFEPPSRGAADPVMLAFTSGTSGDSKGGIITHGVLLNLVRGASNALGISHEDRMPMLFPTSLAVAAYPMFLPLLNGGTLATLDVRSVGLEPVADFLEQERITLAYMAPTVVRFLVDALRGRTFPDLRMIALGGEMVDAEVVQLTTDLFRPELVANGFGTTETGVISLYVMDPDERLEGPAPAGYPVPDVDLMVLDDRGTPVGVGEAGEIAVCSPYMFDGYWGHADLSNSVLQPDPAGRPGWRLYRTGDLGRLDEHGALTVLGRLDTKVKIRGRFVVLGDVETVLHQREDIADAVVVADSRDGVMELVAAVVPAPESQIQPASLRAELLERMEPYRVPSRWLVLEELPRLPNGKLDRRAALRAAAAGAVSGDSDVDGDALRSERSAMPAEPLMRQLRTIWEELLPSQTVGPDDDFFHLGGDSLLAAQMLVLVDDRLGVTVPMGDLLHRRTLRALAESVAAHRAEKAPPSTVSCVQPGHPGHPRLWFVHDLQGSAYRVRHLAEALGTDQPVWSFESPLLRGEPNRFPDLATFAANYLTDLRREQPEGPYRLAGYSFGGICAYEMARQLHRDGEQVEFLGVVDVGPGYRGAGWPDHRSPFRPWFGVAKPPPEGSSPLQVAQHYREMWAASPAGMARHLMVRSGLARHVDPIRFRVDLRRKGRVRPQWRLWYAWEQHWRLAATAWNRSNSYGGRLDLFWADATPSADATMGWGPLVADLHIHRFEGDHEGILEPRGAHALARALSGAIESIPATG